MYYLNKVRSSDLDFFIVLEKTKIVYLSCLWEHHFQIQNEMVHCDLLPIQCNTDSCPNQMIRYFCFDLKEIIKIQILMVSNWSKTAQRNEILSKILLFRLVKGYLIKKKAINI